MSPPAEPVVRPLPGAEAYAPEIAVDVRDRRLAAPFLRDVIEARVTLQQDEPAGFSLVLANTAPTPTGPSGSEKNGSFRYTDIDLLDVETPMGIEMGYAGRTRPMVVGDIVTFAPSFPQSGLPTLTISGCDFFQRLRNVKPGTDGKLSYPKTTDSTIAKAIATRHKLALGEIVDTTPEHVMVTQKPDEDDLTFLHWLAQRNGYVCQISMDKEDERPKLHFRPRDPRDPRDQPNPNVFEYRWGASLLSFSPKISTVGLIEKVIVRSWNSRTKAPIEYTAELKDLPRTSGNGRAGAEVLFDKSNKGAVKEKVVPDRAIQSTEEAKKRAISILEENARQFITGTGEVMGDPELRPGVVLRLIGLGTRFSGEYQVVKTEHVFSSAGYLTTFEVKATREPEKPKKS